MRRKKKAIEDENQRYERRMEVLTTPEGYKFKLEKKTKLGKYDRHQGRKEKARRTEV